MNKALADLSGLAAGHHGGTLLKGELLDTIHHAIVTNPRSLQKQIGPSEVGTPCVRRLAYKLADVAPVNDRPSWKPTVGTAVHAWVADAFIAANAGRPARWLVETRVDVGEINGVPVTGSADLYDLATGTVIDLKVVGTKSMKAKRAANHPGEQYRAQLHLYGRGFTRRGLPVTTVALLALTNNGELSDNWWWTQDYDEQVALAALQRADVAAGLVAAYGASAPGALPTADAFCSYCPFYQPRSTDLAIACPGHPGSSADHLTTPPASLAEALN